MWNCPAGPLLVETVVDHKSDEQTLARMSLTFCLAISTIELAPLSTTILHPWTLIQTSSMFLVESVLHAVTPVMVEVYKTLQYSLFRELITRSRSSSYLILTYLILSPKFISKFLNVKTICLL